MGSVAALMAPQVSADSTYIIIGQAATFTVQLGSPADTLTFENTLGDTMEVVEFRHDGPWRAVVRHTGRVIRGEGFFEVVD